jgi:hypothetical protein
VPEEWICEAIATGILAGDPAGMHPLVRDAHSINLIEKDSDDDFLPLEREIQRRYFDDYPSETLQFTRQDIERLGTYLRKMLVINPKQRATAAELVSDTAWILV